MRISIDIDGREETLTVLKAYFSLKSRFRDSQVTVQRTRHGFHVKAVGKEIEKIPMSDRIRIRQTLGDDVLRLEWDQTKLRNNLPMICETLFSMKRGYDQKLNMVESVDPVALPYASRVPARKWVVK
jgi:hypothetical protein